MKALISGITGQDGALLADHLLYLGYEVYGLARRTSTPSDWRLKELKVLDHPGFHMVSGDLTDQGSLDRAMINVNPDEIYNLAAQSFVGASWNQWEVTSNITGLGAVRVYEAARKFCKDAKIYQASSSEMFGGANRTEKMNEETVFDPRSPYGCAKVFAHNMAKVYRDSYGMFISCGILFNHESEYRGLEFVTRKITDGLVRQHLDFNHEPVKLGNLDAKRDWGAAQDFVRAMHLMLKHHEPDDFVIATGYNHSVKEFCEVALTHLLQIDDFIIEEWITCDDKFKRPADVGCLLGDSSKAKKILGWQPTTSFEEMITIMLEKDEARLTHGPCYT